MTENPRAAVPSEPTTPADDGLRDAIGDAYTAWMYLGWSRTENEVSPLDAIERAVRQWLLRARGEVGPSPEQIEAAAKAYANSFLPTSGNRWEQLDTAGRRTAEERIKIALVAACSVRGPGEAK